MAEEIRAAGGEAFANAADITQNEQVEALVAHTLETWGRIDILVNNAGILRDKSFQKMTLDDFRAVVEVVVRADSLKSELAQVETILAAAGYPKIILLIAESYTDRAGRKQWIQKTSTGAVLGDD